MAPLFNHPVLKVQVHNRSLNLVMGFASSWALEEGNTVDTCITGLTREQIPLYPKGLTQQARKHHPGVQKQPAK